jgi:hypothetical protein
MSFLNETSKLQIANNRTKLLPSAADQALENKEVKAQKDEKLKLNPDFHSAGDFKSPRRSCPFRRLSSIFPVFYYEFFM